MRTLPRPARQICLIYPGRGSLVILDETMPVPLESRLAGFESAAAEDTLVPLKTNQSTTTAFTTATGIMLIDTWRQHRGKI